MPSVPLEVPAFEESPFRIAQNPVHEQIELHYPVTETLESIVLTDMNGRVVKAFQAGAGKGTCSIRLQLPFGLAGGVYFLNISTASDLRASIKVLKAGAN